MLCFVDIAAHGTANKFIVKVPNSFSTYYQKVEREVKQTFQYFQQDPNFGTLRVDIAFLFVWTQIQFIYW
jgi:hypothetical protein